MSFGSSEFGDTAFGSEPFSSLGSQIISEIVHISESVLKLGGTTLFIINEIIHIIEVANRTGISFRFIIGEIFHINEVIRRNGLAIKFRLNETVSISEFILHIRRLRMVINEIQNISESSISSIHRFLARAFAFIT